MIPDPGTGRTIEHRSDGNRSAGRRTSPTRHPRSSRSASRLRHVAGRARDGPVRPENSRWLWSGPARPPKVSEQAGRIGEHTARSVGSTPAAWWSPGPGPCSRRAALPAVCAAKRASATAARVPSRFVCDLDVEHGCRQRRRRTRRQAAGSTLAAASDESPQRPDKVSSRSSHGVSRLMPPAPNRIVRGSISSSAISTSSGSHCVPLPSSSSRNDLRRAERTPVRPSPDIASIESATATTRAERRNRLSDEAVRVAASVPALVVVADDRPYRLEQRERRQHPVADHGVRLHHLRSSAVSAAGFSRMLSGMPILPTSWRTAPSSSAARSDAVRSVPPPDLERQTCETFGVTLHARRHEPRSRWRAHSRLSAQAAARAARLREHEPVDRRPRPSGADSAALNGFVMKPGGAAIERLLQVRLVGRPGHRDDRQARPASVQRVDQLEPGDASRHVDVGQDDGNVFALDQPHRLLGRGGDDNAVPCLGEDPCDQLPDCRLVIDDQHTLASLAVLEVRSKSHNLSSSTEPRES